MSEVETKTCLKETCERAGKQLPLSEFTVNNANTDGRSFYCRHCTRQQSARDRRGEKEPKPLTETERVIAALEGGKRLRFGQLARQANLTYSQLTNALGWVSGKGRQVASKNGTGPRVYFLNPTPIPLKAAAKFDLSEPPLSFSTISFLFPVIGGRR